MAQRERAGLITLRSGVQITSSVLLHFARFTETNRHSSRDVKHEQTLYRDGAGEARGADNPEVTGSKPVPGILHFARFTETRGQAGP